MNTSDRRGNLATALLHTQQLLARNPQAAETQAREILRAIPGEPAAMFLLAIAQRLQNKTGDALAVLRAIVARLPQHSAAWREIGDLHILRGEMAEANEAYLKHVVASVHERHLIAAGQDLLQNRIPEAEKALRAFLKVHPTDIAAIRMLAEVAARLERFEEAERLLTRALELCPGFDAARSNLVTVLHRQSKTTRALAEIDALLAHEPGHPGYRNQKAVVLARLGETEQSITLYRGVLADSPKQPRIWMSFGHTLKTAGHQSEAVEAYREAVRQSPHLGEAWWSLANLKTFRFEDGDIAAMRSELARADLKPEDRLHLDFALGKAFEDAKDYDASFAHYAAANALRHTMMGYEADEVSAHKNTLKRVLTAEVFATRPGGSDAPDPIFVVGLPRSGSTLVEQILASHSAVEGTMELPDIFAMVGRLKDKAGKPFYPDVVLALTPEERRALGEEYLARTRIHRKLGRPFFIDKMPNNFLQIGFIALILPKAKIIDVRRHPLACGFSCFKQHFARGQGFTYSLTDIGRYYADYVELMEHFDAVLPGRIHRIQYETLVGDLEGSVRALLDHCSLEFEEACLSFHQNERIVRTASSEQVRQPLYSDALEQWRHYEKWLDPLKKALSTPV